jgi:hypothetical protein
MSFHDISFHGKLRSTKPPSDKRKRKGLFNKAQFNFILGYTTTDKNYTSSTLTTNDVNYTQSVNAIATGIWRQQVAAVIQSYDFLNGGHVCHVDWAAHDRHGHHVFKNDRNVVLHRSPLHVLGISSAITRNPTIFPIPKVENTPLGRQSLAPSGSGLVGSDRGVSVRGFRATASDRVASVASDG